MSLLLAGYNPARPFRKDFARKPDIIVPIRPPPSRYAVARAGAESYESVRHRRVGTPSVYEHDCAYCGEHFARSYRSRHEKRETCSVRCAARLRWQRTGPNGFGRRKGN